MNIERRLCATALGLMAALRLGGVAAQEVEVLHWWTAGGEALAARPLPCNC